MIAYRIKRLKGTIVVVVAMETSTRCRGRTSVMTDLPCIDYILVRQRALRGGWIAKFNRGTVQDIRIISVAYFCTGIRCKKLIGISALQLDNVSVRLLADIRGRRRRRRRR